MLGFGDLCLSLHRDCYAKEGRIKSAKVGRLVRFEKEYIDGLKSLGEVKTPGRTYITKAERNMRQRK